MTLKFLREYSLLLLFTTFLLIVVAASSFAQQNSAVDAPAAAISSDNAAGTDTFAYSPKGRRDPFKPLIQPKQQRGEATYTPEPSGRPDKIKGPLEKFELSQFRLIALLVVKGVPRAMVKAPDGKSYMVKIGEYIGMNDGIVKKIETKVMGINENGLRVEKSPDRIVVEEISVDSLTGKKVKQYRYIVM
jgi:type IV pilus assembly protein PilP